MKIDVILHDGVAPVLKTIEDTLDGFLQALGCETMQGLTNTHLGHRYGLDVYLDDEGKLNDRNNVITGLFVRDGKVVDFMVGNILICRHDNEGNSTSASMEDFALLPQYLQDGCILRVAGDRYKVADCLLVLPC